MSVQFSPTPEDKLLSIEGVRIGTTQAGIRKANRKDLAVILLDEGASVGAVFTQNRFCAAPVLLCQRHLMANIGIRALLINTGNANAGTGVDGVSRAMATCVSLAQQLDIAPEQVLPFSTGVIMEPLPADRVIQGLPGAVADASPGNWGAAAQAIMTTDTLPKAISHQLKIDGRTVSITGVSKGAGMIRPNMATMLSFIATDAKIAPELMNQLAKELADSSFNRITVDGDTSTNDSFVVVATGHARNIQIDSLESPQGLALRGGMLKVAQWLAHAIVRDGEGATKFITVQCTGAKTSIEALKVCYAVAHSPLVKTAFFASDPNLGRILAAVGYAGIVDLDQAGISLSLDDVKVVQNGARLATYLESDGARVMRQSEICIHIDLGRGDAHDTVWTCDFSFDYVKINADYRS